MAMQNPDVQNPSASAVGSGMAAGQLDGAADVPPSQVIACACGITLASQNSLLRCVEPHLTCLAGGLACSMGEASLGLRVHQEERAPEPPSEHSAEAPAVPGHPGDAHPRKEAGLITEADLGTETGLGPQTALQSSAAPAHAQPSSADGPMPADCVRSEPTDQPPVQQVGLALLCRSLP